MASRQAHINTQSSVHPPFHHSTGTDAERLHVARPQEQEVAHLADELEDLMGRDDIAKVTNQLAESSIITQLLEQVQTGTGNTPYDMAEEEEWIEVDRVLDGEDTSSEGIAPLPPTSLNDAADHTRLHTVLENMTRRIMKRRNSRSGRDWDLEKGAPTPKAIRHFSPEPESPAKSSPSKRSSPFKAISQAKSAFARRIRFRSSPTKDEEDCDNSPEESPQQTIHEKATGIVDLPTTLARSDHVGLVEGPESRAGLPKDEVPDMLFPHDSLVTNLHRFMRYSSAAYGVSLSSLYPALIW
jgi:hypothetical protein